MLRAASASSVASVASAAARLCTLLWLLSLPSLPAVHAAPAGQRAAPREFAEVSVASGRAGLPYPTVRWITETDSERRIDDYAFDCAHGRYAHVLSERYRGTTRIERVALAEVRWAAALRPLPPKYPMLAVHRARAIACAPGGGRR